METAEFDVVEAIAQVLSSACSAGAAPHETTKEVTPFTAPRKPTISIHDYAKRLTSGFFCSRECYILCIVYIERVMQRKSSFAVDNSNVHRLLLASMVVAAKFHDDTHGRISFYSKVAGVTIHELAVLEAHFMMMLDWRAHVTPDEYNNCFNRVRCRDASLCLAVQKAEVSLASSCSLQSVPSPVILYATADKGRFTADLPDARLTCESAEDLMHESNDNVPATTPEPGDKRTLACHRSSQKRSATWAEEPSKHSRICLAVDLYLATVCRDSPLNVLQYS